MGLSYWRKASTGGVAVCGVPGQHYNAAGTNPMLLVQILGCFLKIGVVPELALLTRNLSLTNRVSIPDLLLTPITHVG